MLFNRLNGKSQLKLNRSCSSMVLEVCRSVSVKYKREIPDKTSWCRTYWSFPTTRLPLFDRWNLWQCKYTLVQRAVKSGRPTTVQYVHTRLLLCPVTRIPSSTKEGIHKINDPDQIRRCFTLRRHGKGKGMTNMLSGFLKLHSERSAGHLALSKLNEKSS